MKAMIAALSVCIAAGACTSAQNGTASVDDVSSAALRDAVITIERTPCFGTCPVYSLSMTGEGVVTFKGERFVRVIGTAMDTVPADSVAALVAEIRDAGYFSMQEKYTPESASACGLHHTDAPSVTTSVTVSAQSKTIAHYHGCNAAPAGLRKIEDAIDRIANTKQWLNPN